MTPRPSVSWLIVLAMQAGCGTDPHAPVAPGHVETYVAYLQPPEHLDPARGEGGFTPIVLSEIYEPPFTYDLRSRALRPLLAESVPVPRYLDASGQDLPPDAPPTAVTLTALRVQLRAGVIYADHPAFAGAPAAAREVTSADVVRGIVRLADPALASPAAPALARSLLGFADLQRRYAEGAREGRALEGARVVDRRTLELRFLGRAPRADRFLATTFAAPIPAVAERYFSSPARAVDGLSLDRSPLGTGAFRVTSLAPGRIVLERNPRHRDAGAGRPSSPCVPVDGATLLRERDHSTRVIKFDQGHLDLAVTGPDRLTQALVETVDGGYAPIPSLAAEGMRVEMVAYPVAIFFALNMDDPVVGGLDVRGRNFRRALSIVLDTQELQMMFRQGRDVLADGPLPRELGGHGSFDRGFNRFVYVGKGGRRRSLAEAREALRLAGYPGGVDPHTGRPLAITFHTLAQPTDRPFIDWLRNQLGKLGLALEPRFVDPVRFNDAIREGRFQLVRWGYRAPYPDPEAYLAAFYGPNVEAGPTGNLARYRNAEYDALFETIRTLDDGPERARIIDRMVAILQEDAPWIWDVFQREPMMVHGWVSGTDPTWDGALPLSRRCIDVAKRRAHQDLHAVPSGWTWALGLALVLCLGAAFVLQLRTMERRGPPRTKGRAQ